MADRSPVRIAPYNQRTVADGPATPLVDTDTRSPLAAIARGVGELGEGARDLHQANLAVERLQAAQREDDARVQVMHELARARSRANTQLQTMRDNAVDGAAGMTKGFEQWFDTDEQDARSRMLTPEAQRLFEESWLPFRMDALDLAARSEREEGRAFRMDRTREALETSVSGLVTDPGAFANVLEEQSALIAGMRDTTPDERRDLLSAFEQDAAQAAVTAMVQQNPGQMLRLLQQPPGDNPDPRNPLSYLDARARVSLMGQAQAAVDRIQARARAALMDEMQLQAADLDAGIPVQEPISVERIRAVFGERQANAWQLRLAASEQHSGLARSTNAELAQILATPRPGGDASADDIRMHEARRLAATRIMERRQDPQAFLLQQGVSDAGVTSAFTAAIGAAEPQREQAWGQFFDVLRRRGTAATVGAQQFGMEALPLTQEEAAYIGNALNGMRAQDREAFFQRARRALTIARPRHAAYDMGPEGASPGETVYGRLAAQLTGEGPTTAYAGYLYGVDGETMDGQAVARLILRGEDILAGGGRGADGQPRQVTPVNMPSEDDLRTAWSRLVGDAYSRTPEAGAQAYQAFRAQYAALSEREDPASGRIDRDRARRSARGATGGVVTWSGGETLLPWGMAPETFEDRVNTAWPALQARYPEILGDANASDYDLIATRQPGVYALHIGGRSEQGPDGREILIRIPTGRAAAGLSGSRAPMGDAPPSAAFADPSRPH